MKNKCPIKGKIAYLVGLTLRAESAIFGSGCGSLAALEQHLPDIFVRSVEEPAQSLVLRRIELPHVEAPSLARENPVDEHDLDYVDKLELLVHQLLDTGLESGQLLRIPQIRPLSFQEVSRVGMPDLNSGAAAQSGSRGSVM